MSGNYSTVLNCLQQHTELYHIRICKLVNCSQIENAFPAIISNHLRLLYAIKTSLQT